MSYEFTSAGIPALAKFTGEITGKMQQAAVRAVNRGAAATRTDAAREIISQVNLSASYLSPSNGKLVVKGIASAANMQASVFSEASTVSLARYVTSGAVGQKGGVTVQVKKGHSVYLKNAFLIKLKRGTTLDKDNFNIGLAIRLKPGESIRNKNIKMMKNGGGLALLYGPSVSQSFDRILGFNQYAERAADIVASEFDRQMRLD